jgi:hypothetical protein
MIVKSHNSNSKNQGGEGDYSRILLKPKS